MVDKVQKQRQAVVVVDIADRDDVMRVELIFAADIVDQLIGVFKDAGSVQSDQSLLCLQSSDFLIDGQGKITGDRTDEQ